MNLAFQPGTVAMTRLSHIEENKPFDLIWKITCSLMPIKVNDENYCELEYIGPLHFNLFYRCMSLCLR